MSGTLDLEEGHFIFEAAMIPVAPYENGQYNPFPLFTIEAVDDFSGDVIATTRGVAPSPTVMAPLKIML